MEQISLFSTVEDAPEAGDGQFALSTLFAPRPIPQEVVDAVLRLGGNGRDSALHICAAYQGSRSAEGRVSLLKQEYDAGGRGLAAEGKEYAVWYGDDGLHIQSGRSARYSTQAHVLTWEAMEHRIRELLEIGHYLPQAALDLALERERTECAHDLCDLTGDIKETYFKGDLFAGYDHQEKTKRVSEAMQDPDLLEAMTDELETFLSAYQKNPQLLRYRRRGMDRLHERMRSLQGNPRMFIAAPDFTPLPAQSFISEDEINAELTRGSGIDQGKFRIYAYLRQGHGTKELAGMLKAEYGSGGHGPALNADDGDEWHDPKGIRLKRGLCPDVLLTWANVAKRITALAAAGRYMSPAELARIPAYEKSVLTVELFHFFSNLPATAQVPFPISADYYESERAIRPMLEEERRVTDLIASMESILEMEAVQEDQRRYSDREKALADIRAFRDGTFSLFTRVPKLPTSKATVADQDRLDDVDPIRLRERLAQAGIVNGQVVDPTALDNDPFIRQVTADVERITHVEQADDTQVNDLPAPIAQNFRITDDHLGEGGPKSKFAANIAAIETMRRVEAEDRPATPEEQDTLSRYVGWGGLADAFDPQKEKWAAEYAKLKDLLTIEEYEAARASVLTAYYTSPTVIRAIYQGIESMGFQHGNILEPSMGVGNFFGLLPEHMAGSKLFGAELDPLTGRLAKRLYPQARIEVTGYEKTRWPDSFFDVAVGNVPFGAYSVSDPRYDKLHYHIHDYFFAKTIDQLRPGGVMAFVTSHFTMDKKNSTVRKYLAQRCELLGAVRLPNNAFLANAGTEVTADILFLQKRDRPVEREDAWIQIGLTPDGLTINQYFLDHPDMVLGTLVMEQKMYGSEGLVCKPFPDSNLDALLSQAIGRIHATIPLFKARSETESAGALASIEADPTVRNYSYTLVDDRIYFRENSRMNPVETGQTGEARIRGLIEVRDAVRTLMDAQMDGCDNDTLHALQGDLNACYDRYTASYGLMNSRGNSMAFSDDASYPLLCALEVLNEDGTLKCKADMFTKRTIRQESAVTHADTAAEALAISIGDRACVDLGYMSSLMGRPGEIEPICTALRGVIFRDPESGEDPLAGWQTADEYLSGNVRDKLRTAQRWAASEPGRYDANVEALTAAQPKVLEAGEIGVRLGTTWIPQEDYQQFVFELLGTPQMYHSKINVVFSGFNGGSWNVSGKHDDRSNNIKAFTTYGTKRVNAYELIQDSLNLKDVKIFDTQSVNGKDVRVFNRMETMLAQRKQESIQQAFKDWVWKDPQRRDRLAAYYNEHFNNTRPREYDGSHIKFVGMNPEIALRPHQQNAVARILYGGNSLLAHVVGAGKTWTMAAAAMEGRRLGLCQKSLFVVPSHLTEQWGAEFLQLYPAANILVSTKKDFEKVNRRRFCARISTGDYDAVIIGHSQFEKIPVSAERQEAQLKRQIYEIELGIEAAKEADGERYTIKQMEYTRKTLGERLKALTSTNRKDDTITFEELGVDRLFVDEAHYYKNLFLYTKMRNVAGISQTEAQKSSDLYMKCLYMDELTARHPGGPGRGVIFATGTPISNSMTELYTMMRYLQGSMLEERGLSFFDAWATTFGETAVVSELAPEGSGYRMKTRFSRFYNLPELINLWKEVTDVQTADMLNLPVPKARYHTEVIQPTELQRHMVHTLGERAEVVRKGDVEPNVDNMLKITNDGRNLALDQRQINPIFPDAPDSKVNRCVDHIFRIWEETAPQRSAQMIFSDLSTPKAKPTIQLDQAEDGSFAMKAPPFSVYYDIKEKLMARGVPEREIAFIHDANTDSRKAELFAKVRAGTVRVLLGSTAKMGAGTNAQTRLFSLHHLDVPWRPSDIEQREGRILRQGNTNPEVDIFRYVTEGTFDAYSWQLIEGKQRVIGQIMTSKSPARSCEDIDATALSFAEVKALATGNPKIKEKMDLDVEVAKLALLRSNFNSEQYRMEDQILKSFPAQIRLLESKIAACEADIKTLSAHVFPSSEDLTIEIAGRVFHKKAPAGEAIIAFATTVHSIEPVQAGAYRGLELRIYVNKLSADYVMQLHGAWVYSTGVGNDPVGNITRLNNVLDRIPEDVRLYRSQLDTLHQQLEDAKAEVQKPWPQEAEWKSKSERLTELNIELSMAMEANPGNALPQTLSGNEDGGAAMEEDELEPDM